MLRFVGISPVISGDFMRLYSLVLHNEHDAKKEFREVSRKLFYYPRTFRGAIAGAENPGKTYLCTDDKKRFLVPTGVSRMHKGRRRPPEPVNEKRGCKITACEKRRIPGKGSSVDIFSVFSLWNPFSNEKGHIDHIPGKVWISWG